MHVTSPWYSLFLLPNTSHHDDKVDFTGLAHVVANSWKGLQPEIKVAYGKLAAFQQHLFEKEKQQQLSAPPTWKNHVKVVESPKSLSVPSLVEDDVAEEIVEDVFTELEKEESQAETKETSPPPPPPQPFWPLQGASAPIADFIRSARHPQLTLEHTQTCLACVEPPAKRRRTGSEIAELSAVLEEDGKDFFLRALLY